MNHLTKELLNMFSEIFWYYIGKNQIWTNIVLIFCMEQRLYCIQEIKTNLSKF